MKEYNCIVASSIGSSHIKTCKPCQDKVLSFSSWSHKGIGVCDGHGLDKHFRSEIGAEFATIICRDSIELLAKYISNKKSEIAYLDRLKDLEKSIVTKWNYKVIGHFNSYPFSEQELSCLTDKDRIEVINNPYVAYGSTMLFAYICNEHLFISQLGDGDCRLLTSEGIVAPFEDDENLKFGRTTSLCGGNAVSQIRHRVMDLQGIKACFLSTDGVKNSFDSEDNFQEFIKTIVGIARREGYKKAQKDLKEFLPQLSKRGSGDDVSIGILL